MSYWDKEKHQPRSKQVFIGKLDPATEEFIPSKRTIPALTQETECKGKVTATIVGPLLILDAFVHRLGIDRILNAALPEYAAQILSMAYYLACQGGPLSQCEAWTRTHEHPASTALASQRISEILGAITTAAKQGFFSLWMNKILEDEYLCYDITSISSYSAFNDSIR